MKKSREKPERPFGFKSYSYWEQIRIIADFLYKYKQGLLLKEIMKGIGMSWPTLRKRLDENPNIFRKRKLGAYALYYTRRGYKNCL